MEKAFLAQGHHGRFPWQAEEVKWGTDWDGMVSEEKQNQEECEEIEGNFKMDLAVR